MEDGDQHDAVSPGGDGLAGFASLPSYIPTPRTADALYTSLPISNQPRMIRVLDVDGLPAWHGEPLANIPLTGTLRAVSLSTCPAFTALSYVWGKPSSLPDFIFCGNCEIEITTNCRDALRQLRRRYGSFTIWVDAICINQKDDHEKITQIPLMDEIYTWARQVFIWLGNGNEKSDRALRYLLAVSSNTTSLCLAGVPWISTFDRMERRKAMIKYKLLAFSCYHRHFRQCVGAFFGIPRASTNIRPCDYEAISDLLGREWSQRAWTFQEVILASNPVILCGDLMINWDGFVHGIEFLWEDDKSRKSTHEQSLRPSSDEESLYLSSDLPQSFHYWRNLIDIWMSTTRPTHWGTTQLRSALPEGTSFRTYQQRHVDIHTGWNDMKVLATICYIFGCVILILLATSVLSILVCCALMSGTLLTGGELHWLGPLPNIAEYWGSILWIFPASALANTAVGVLNILFHTSAKVPDKSGSTYELDSTSASQDGLISALRERFSSDPKDRSYALHGVLRNLRVQLSTPDYAKSTGQVYQDLFTDLLCWRPLLLRLLIDVSGSTFPDAATWVPDWTSVSETTWLDWNYLYDTHEQSATPESQPYAIIRGHELEVMGRLIDVVQFVSTASKRIDTDTINSTDPLTLYSLFDQTLEICRWIAVLQNKVPVSESYDSVPKAIFSVLEGRLTTSHDTHARHFNEWYRSISAHLREAVDGGTFESMEPLFNALSEHQEALAYLIRCCNNLAGKRTLLVAGNGFIGSAPPSMRVDDQIVLVAGVPVPLILRPQSGTTNTKYALVGPAFVQGYMMGEAWDDGRQLEQIILV